MPLRVRQEVQEVLRSQLSRRPTPDTYPRGLRRLDTYSVSEGSVQDESAPDWFQRIQNRPSPASQGAARRDEIIFIDLNGTGSALAKVQVSSPSGRYSDYLSILKLNLNTAERQVSDRMQEFRKFRCAWHYASACRGAWVGRAAPCRFAVAG